MLRTIGIIRSFLLYYGNPFNARRLRRLYAGFLHPGSLYFDLGAHLGNRIQAALRCGSRVVALEPNPDLFRILQHRFGDHDDVTLLRAAIADYEGQATLYLSERTPTVSTLSSAWIDSVRGEPSFTDIKWNKELVVDVTTLDSLINRFGRPAFCKLDIEGYELTALHGLSVALPALSFEYLPQRSDEAEECILYLESLGSYVYNWATGEQFRLGAPRWVSPNDMVKNLHTTLLHGRSGDIYARLRHSLPDLS